MRATMYSCEDVIRNEQKVTHCQSYGLVSLCVCVCVCVRVRVFVCLFVYACLCVHVCCVFSIWSVYFGAHKRMTCGQAVRPVRSYLFTHVIACTSTAVFLSGI